mmetsp:Transcript_3063/g.5889  ORF Transcript_3063/g.5889 Transcript_3063/m.5889 type:complete len:80 (+) Transcript_3063:64-303(+)
MKSFRAYRLPCDVDYRGEVENREEYFSIAEVPEGFSEVQFRGRMLRGVAMDGVQGAKVDFAREWCLWNLRVKVSGISIC